MIRFSIPVEIDRPVEEVFAFVTDPDRLGEWQTSTVSVQADGPMGKGTRLREVHRAPFGRNLESVVEVAEYEPNRRFDLKVLDGPLPLDGRHAFSAHNVGGTRIDFEAEGRPAGAMRLAEPLLKRQLEKQFRAYFARLKELLER